MFAWLRRKKRPVDDPLEPAYWQARGVKHANICAVAYEWGQIDEQGNPLPEPHTPRKKR